MSPSVTKISFELLLRLSIVGKLNNLHLVTWLIGTVLQDQSTEHVQVLCVECSFTQEILLMTFGLIYLKIHLVFFGYLCIRWLRTNIPRINYT